MAHRTPLLAALCILVFATFITAQGPANKKETAPKTTKTKATKPDPARSEEEEALAAQQRIVAVSLLTALADDAHSFRDARLRARVEARAADALWDSDPEKARALFKRAWDDAAAADAEANKNTSDDFRRARAGGGPVVVRGRPDLQTEVLRLAAKRDSKLGEDFLKTLEAAAERDADEAAAEMRRNTNAADPSAAKRLQLARRLLEDGEIQRALQFAGPVLDQVNRDTINFLSALREKNAQAADQGFLSLLSRAERDPASDANTVSGLSSYAFTPFIYITFSPDGGANQMQERGGNAVRPDLQTAVRSAFFRVAMQILLRPSPALDQDRTSAGRVGKYMVMKRLLPLFEEYEPEKAANLRTQMAALAADVPEDARNGENRAINRGIVPEDTSKDPLDAMQNRLDRAKTTEERDAIYADYAVALAGKGDQRAKDLVDKIEDTEMRKSVRGYTDFQFAQLAVRNKDIAEATRLAKNGELTSLQRVWIQTRTAQLLLDTDRPRALEILEAAASEARRISGGEQDRPKALMAVASGMIQVDRVRAWEIITEGVKAANSVEGFSGEDSSVTARLQTKQMVLISNSASYDFDLTGAFRALARDDFQRSIEVAKSFTSESPRSLATLAVARSVLEKKPASTAQLN
jgi:hypothetical protein